MPNGSDTFSKNIDLLMSRFKLTQSELADAVGFPRTTVNKWFISNAIPNEHTLLRLCSGLNDLLIKYYPDADRDKTTITPALLVGNPYMLATAIAMPWYKVGSIVNKARIPMKNLIFEPNDNDIENIVGFYTIIYPSVAYNGAFYAAALKIIRDRGDEFFYFSQFSRESRRLDHNTRNRWEIPTLYHSGSVGRFGKDDTGNAVLIGDLVGEHGEDVESFVQFTTFKIPKGLRPRKLFGRVLALNFNKESKSFGHLLSTPAIALAMEDDIDKNCSVKELAPKKAYFDLNEMTHEYPAAVSALEQSPVPWCYNCVVLDKGR